MKRLSLCILLLVGTMVFFVGGISPITGANIRGEATITVQGEGSFRVTPDLTLLYMGVEVTAPTAQEAQRENSDIMQAVLDQLFLFGISKDEIKTTYFSLWAVTEYEEGETVHKGFRVSHTLEVPVADIDKTGEILDAVVAAGINVVNNVTFSLRDTKGAYEKALLKAIESAHNKAGALANAEGLSVGEIKEIVEKRTYAPYYGAEGEAGQFAITPFMPGQLKVEAIVEVTFYLSV